MQDTEIQFVTETGKVRNEWQMSWATTSPTKWGSTSFKTKCSALENCIQTTCLDIKIFWFVAFLGVFLSTYRSQDFSLI